MFYNTNELRFENTEKKDAEEKKQKLENEDEDFISLARHYARIYLTRL